MKPRPPLRTDHVLAQRPPVRVRRDGRRLGQQQHGGQLDRGRVERVHALGVVARQRGDRGGQHGHRVGVGGERPDQRLEVVVQVRVALDPLDPAGQLLVGRELTVDEQVGDLEERGLLGQLVDRVAAVEQDALAAVDVGDGRLARRGVHEARVDRHGARLAQQGGDHDPVVAHRGAHSGQFQGRVVDLQTGRGGGLGHASSSRTGASLRRQGRGDGTTSPPSAPVVPITCGAPGASSLPGRSQQWSSDSKACVRETSPTAAGVICATASSASGAAVRLR